MLTEGKIKAQVRRLLAHEQSLDEFHEWLARNTWNITREQPDSHARTLAGQIELALAEYSNGHLKVRDLRERLAELVGGHPLAANQDS